MLRLPTRADTPYEMQARDGNLWLSPSDVTAFLGCEHATTLSVRAARGELEVPAAPNDAGAADLPQGPRARGGVPREPAQPGQDRRRDLARADLDWERGRQRDDRGDARRRRRRLPGRLRRRRLARRRRLPGARRDAVGTRQLELRGARHEARAQREAGLHPPALLLRRAARPAPGTRAGADPRAARVGRAGELPAAGVRRLLPARPLAARSSSSTAGRDTTPYPNDHCGICDFKPLCDAWWDAVDHLCRVAGHPAAADRAARGGRDHDARRRSGARRPSPRRAGMAPRRSRSSASRRRCSSGRASTAATASSLLQPQPDAGFALLPEPSPGDLFFDFEGNPFWDTDGSLEYLWGILDAERQLHAALGARPRDASGRAFEQFVDLVHERLARVPGPARLPLRRLRDHRAQAADGPLRHPRGRARRPAAARRLRRPLQGRPQRPPRLAAGLRAEGDGGVPRLPPAGGGEGRRHLDRHVRGVDADARPGAARRDRRLQRGGLHRDAAAARLAARAARRGARASSGRSRCRSRSSRSRSPEGKAERAALREALLDGGRGARRAAARLPRPRAQAGLVGVLRPARDDARGAARGRRVDRRARARRRARAGASGRRPTRSRFPAQEHKLGHGQDTFDPATGRSPGEIVELDRDERRLVLKRGPSSTDVPLPRGADPRAARTTPTTRRTRSMRLGRSLLAGDRRYPALESVLRREPFAAPIQTTDLDEMKALVLSLDGRHLVIQGPPGSGKTWTSGRLIAHLLDARQARRRRLDEPQGDPQPARRGRGGGRRARARVPRAEEGERRQPRVVLRRLASDRERHRRRRLRRLRPRRRHGLALLARASTTARSTTSSSTRPARSRSPTRSRWAPARATSCSSATRSSSTR